jgi:hypothetical protein
MKKIHLFEILGVLGAFEVSLQTNLKGSKDSKVLKQPFSKQDDLTVIVLKRPS